MRSVLILVLAGFGLAAACSSGGDTTGTGGAGAGSSSSGGSTSASTSDTTTSSATGTTSGTGGATTSTSTTASASVASSAASTSSGGPGVPPFGGSSMGQGGPAPVAGQTEMASGITYRLIVPGSYKAGQKAPLLIVYSGTEGGANMTQNLMAVAQVASIQSFLCGVLDGVQYNGDGQAGATVLDELRAKYDIDNDRTYLLGESAGTSAAEQLGFQLRESYFAAYWANDVNAVGTPGMNASMIGFQPWGQVGPGGQQAIAQQIVDGMKAANYRLPNPAPYNGPGSGTHGDPNQFIAAVSWFPGKTRQ